MPSRAPHISQLLVHQVKQKLLMHIGITLFYLLYVLSSAKVSASIKAHIAFVYDNNITDKSIRKVRMSGRTGCGREPVGQTRICNNSLTLPAFPSLPPLCINSRFHRLFGIPFRKSSTPLLSGIPHCATNGVLFVSKKLNEYLYVEAGYLRIIICRRSRPARPRGERSGL